jgi:myo-inositol-1-phosphate synthase
MSPVSLTDSSALAASVTPVLNDVRPSVSQLTGGIPPQPVDPTAERRLVGAVEVDSPDLTYTDEALYAKYAFHSTAVKKTTTQEGQLKYEVKPVERLLEFKTERKVPKTGCVSFLFASLLQLLVGVTDQLHLRL